MWCLGAVLGMGRWRVGGGGASEAGCEIFSSHSTVEADSEGPGSAARRQVIHTLMHSITQEIEACMFACQTLAAGGLRRGAGEGEQGRAYVCMCTRSLGVASYAVIRGQRHHFLRQV